LTTSLDDLTIALSGYFERGAKLHWASDLSQYLQEDAMQRAELLKTARRLVVKLGTATLMRDEGGVALSRFYAYVEAIAAQIKAGREMLVVTSGAIGLGLQRLGFSERPKHLPQKQACAAVGQGHLMALYADAFEQLGIVTAQILLTEEDFSNRHRYLNLRSTISELLRMHVLPIINENDTVSTSELEADNAKAHRKVNFGDNDRLSALVASKTEAELLIILTDVDGFFSVDPRLDPNAKLISEVTDIDALLEELENGKSSDSSKLGRGGIKTKLAAAKIAAQSGCATIVANGKLPGILSRLFAGDELGTLVVPKHVLKGKQRWIAFATTVKAALVVNEGAQEALTKRKASLLAAGVIEVRDSFDRGDVVSIVNKDGHEFARGIVNYSSSEAKRITGMHSAAIDEKIEDRNYDALVTRDNIAFLD
jgi:glutamate 5-kinase